MLKHCMGVTEKLSISRRAASYIPPLLLHSTLFYQRSLFSTLTFSVMFPSMEPLHWPPNPIFKSEGEEEVFNILKKNLGSEDALLANVTFQDPKEGDIEIDLILLSASKGICIIENKGGHIEFNGQKWIQTDKNGSRPIDPHKQVLKNMYSFREYLRANWNEGNIKTDWMLVFPGSFFPNSTHIPGVPRNRIVDRSEVGSVLDQAIQILEGNQQSYLPRSADWVTKAYEVFKGKSLIESDREIAIFNNYTFVKNQTHERRSLLQHIQDNNRFMVQGPAGSGKSWLAFEQADIWASQGLKVAIVVLNRGIESYMQMKNKEKKKNRAEWVGTFHMLMKALGSPIGMIEDYLGNEEAIDARILAAAENAAGNFKFDAIVVDEAQDIYDGWWPALMALLKDEKSKMAIFGDLDQKIAGNRGMPEKGFAKIRLFENLRNCRQIAEAVAPFCSSQVIVRGPQAYEIEFVEVETEAGAIDAAEDVVARITDEELWSLGEIALLTTKHQHPIHKDKVQTLEGSQAYWAELWAKEDVFYGTVAGFKGLERSVVILAIDGFHQDKDVSGLLYVGMTRARDRLVVVGTAEQLDKLKGYS
jgi:hypothetical protein